MNKNATIYSINGPVVKSKLAVGFQMLEMVYVGDKQLLGEVIGIDDIYTTIQVYESTTGLKIGEPIYKTDAPLGATLAPGILTNIFDGIQRPLKEMAEASGMYVSEGRGLGSLNETKLWDITITAKVGDKVNGGDIFALTQETS